MAWLQIQALPGEPLAGWLWSSQNGRPLIVVWTEWLRGYVLGLFPGIMSCVCSPSLGRRLNVTKKCCALV
jgi:hypothetical protein